MRNGEITKVTFDEQAALALPEVAEDLTRRGERVADRARADAPVKTGTYRDAIRVEEDVVDGVPTVLVIADVDYSVFVEAETGNLSRSLDAAAG